MAGEKVLIVDDEEHIVELIKFNLNKNGYEVLSAENGEECLRLMQSHHVDLIILDLMLPGMDGFEICKEIRKVETFNRVPIVMLTAKGEETDRVLGLEFGADDYITKPFSVRELIARIKAVLRRTNNYNMTTPAKVIKVRDLVIDTEKHEVIIKGQPIELTLKEFELLKILAMNRGKVLSRNILLDEVWGYDFIGETRTVDVHIRNLRKKMDDNEIDDYIETIRGIGYKMK